MPQTLIPPPEQALRVRLRRTFRSRRGLTGLAQWFVDIGIPLLLAFAAFYIVSGIYEGWRVSYKVLLGMEEPPAKGIPLLPWTVSLVGWLLAPAMVGGLAGHIIAARISRTGGTTSKEPFVRRTWGERLTPPPVIDWLGSYFHGRAADVHFVECFVRIAHKNDWARAQDHWEVAVTETMRSVEFSALGRIENLPRAQSHCKVVLRIWALIGVCAVCEARK
ncbi:DUF6313 family protein [Streptomyces sp. NPDC026206]|uniref:DUF6313 family protein n=1 Tax=Streptomyces sp. NPDC026206 TaxID=3157089 RepID=UPI0033C0F31A